MAIRELSNSQSHDVWPWRHTAALAWIARVSQPSGECRAFIGLVRNPSRLPSLQKKLPSINA